MLKVKALRIEREWSQTTAAYFARLTAPDLSRIERGILRPSRRQLARLAAAFECEAAALLEEVAEPLVGGGGADAGGGA